MKPFSIYQTCQELSSGHLEQLVPIIAAIAKPDMIYLLGASLHRRRSESIFCPEAPTAQHTSGYYFLVLLPDFISKEQYDWQDQVERQCAPVVPVTCIVLKTATFQQWLSNHHAFATKVVASAPIIYEAGTVSVSLPPDSVETSPSCGLETFYRDAFNRATGFLAGAELFKVRGQYNMSAFMLHQSAEQSLRAMLKIGTGYHNCTHNLDRLVRYTSMVSYQLPDIFSVKSEKDRLLFKLLQSAYSDARYTEDYTINIQQLTALTEKVTRVLDLFVSFGSKVYNKNNAKN